MLLQKMDIKYICLIYAILNLSIVIVVSQKSHPECGESPALKYKNLAKAIGYITFYDIKFILKNI